MSPVTGALRKEYGEKYMKLKLNGLFQRPDIVEEI